MSQPLNPATFHILLALASSERHGYDIMKQTTVDSQGSVKLGPGTLYSAIKKMVDSNLIETAESRPDASLDDSRRIYYRLTALGRKSLGTELDRLDHMVRIGRRHGFTEQVSFS